MPKIINTHHSHPLKNSPHLPQPYPDKKHTL